MKKWQNPELTKLSVAITKEIGYCDECNASLLSTMLDEEVTDWKHKPGHHHPSCPNKPGDNQPGNMLPEQGDSVPTFS